MAQDEFDLARNFLKQRASHIEEYAAAWLKRNPGVDVNLVALIQEYIPGGVRMYYAPREDDKYLQGILMENKIIKEDYKEAKAHLEKLRAASQKIVDLFKQTEIDNIMEFSKAILELRGTLKETKDDGQLFRPPV